MRYGCWAEFVYISESSLTHKPDTYTFSQAASLPMQALVAYGAVKAAGFINKPVLDNIKHKDAVAEDIETVVDSENKALITKEGTDLELANKAKVAVVGVSSTTGLMVVDMLVSRGVAVVGVSSASSSATVISNGAVAVLGMFSSMKYTQAAMPMTRGPKIIEHLLNEGLKTVADSEVEMFDQDSMISGVAKVNNHKTRGRLVFINDSI